MHSFYFSMAYSPCEDPETVNGMVIRTGKKTYLHAPVVKIDADSREVFASNIFAMAEKIWDHVEALNKQVVELEAEVETEEAEAKAETEEE